jgi:hypothetical protein
MKLKEMHETKINKQTTTTKQKNKTKTKQTKNNKQTKKGAWVRARLCKLQKRCTRLAAQVIKFTSCLPMVGGSLRVLRPSSTTKTGRHDIAEILLKVTFNFVF